MSWPLINRLKPTPAHEADRRALTDLCHALIDADRKLMEAQWELKAAIEVRDAHRAAFRLQSQARSLAERDDQLAVEERRLVTIEDPATLDHDGRNWADVLALVAQFGEQVDVLRHEVNARRLQYDTARRNMRHQEAFQHGND